MEENFNKQKYEKLDTINLMDLFRILGKRKKLIILITLLITIFSYLYTSFVIKPTYSGSATVELGQVINKNVEKGTVQVINLESIPVLQGLIQTKFGVSVIAINGSTLLKYSLTSADKNYIKKSLNEAIKYTLDRDKKRVKLYAGSNANIINSSVVTPLSVSNEPIKPKKKLVVIVSFITGLLFSIFLAFFLEFLTEAKKKRI